MLENVRGFLDPGFEAYREKIFSSIQALGYVTHIKLLNASDYGVPQLRPRVVIIGIRKDQPGAFVYPEERPDAALTVGETIQDLIAQNGWKGAKQWAKNAWAELGSDDAIETLDTLVQGKRLKDISDLPLDLSV